MSLTVVHEVADAVICRIYKARTLVEDPVRRPPPFSLRRNDRNICLLSPSVWRFYPRPRQEMEETLLTISARSQGLPDSGQCPRSHYGRPSLGRCHFVGQSLWYALKPSRTATVLKLPSKRHRYPIPTTLGPGYGHLEQQRGYHGSG